LKSSRALILNEIEHFSKVSEYNTMPYALYATQGVSE